MNLSSCRVLVTGGAGFIGSHLVDALMSLGAEVYVLDNLSSGRFENIGRWVGNPSFTFIRGDLLKPSDVFKAVKDSRIVFHLAANSEVRLSSINPSLHYRHNVEATFNLLEVIRRLGGVEVLAFTSSSTVYGEASKIPTPEDYGPLKPISVYGASKLACEALITAYAYTYGFKAVIYRLANVVGSRSKHGVVHDFIEKLRRSPRQLEILGDGSQRKSYLHVDDCVDAMLLGLNKSAERVEVYNVGSEDQVDVRTIAGIVIEEMGLKDVELRFTGGVEGGRGWRGDIKVMLLDVGRIKSLGWKPRFSSAQAVREAVKALLAEST